MQAILAQHDDSIQLIYTIVNGTSPWIVGGALEISPVEFPKEEGSDAEEVVSLVVSLEATERFIDGVT